MNIVIQFAAEAAHQADTGLVGALGIDGKLLLLQSLAFLVLVFILGKFVYPYLIKAIDDRRASIEEGMQNARKAEEELRKAEEKVAEIIRGARAEADDMLAHTQKEASTIIEAAEAKAVKRAEHIVEQAQADMHNELTAARDALKQETAQLVALATERIIKQKVDAKSDAQLVAAALKESK